MARPQSAKPAQPQVGIGLPNYVLIQLRALAAREHCSLRYLVLKALTSLGIHVEPKDLKPDKREGRPKGTRNNYARKASGKKHRT